MRHIIQDYSGLQISFSHAALENEGLTNVTISVPLDADKYMDGVNIIECIQERLLPNFTVDAITQELTSGELDLLGGLAVTTVVTPYVSDVFTNATVFSNAMNLLAYDDASLGVISFELGKRKATYTL
jgi:hypothetical protein